MPRTHGRGADIRWGSARSGKRVATCHTAGSRDEESRYTSRMVHRIETEADIAAGLAALTAADPRLAALTRIAGPVPLRRRPGGFAGLASIVVSQQLSTMSAAAIWGRLS